MITVSLYHKYRTALDDIAQDSADRQHITTNAANLALLLAMQELDAAWRERCLPAQAEPTQNRQQIERINAWLREHAPDDFWTDDDTATSIIAAADRLRGQVARLQAMLAAADADVQRSNARLEQLIRINDWIISYAADAIAAADRLRGTVERLRIELETAIDERNAADGEVASLEAEVARLTTAYNDVNGELAKAIRHAEGLAHDLATLRSYAIATPHGNGKSKPAAGEAERAGDLPEQYPPAIVAAVEQEAAAEAAQQAALDVGDDAELHDYIIGLDAKRHIWRTIPKSVRWRLVKARLNSIWTDGKLPSMVDFDADRPAWMPTASACAVTFGDGKWSIVCEKAGQP
jgi:hypothetical protein